MSFPTLITPKLIAQFEKATGLTFISDETLKGNVCFADNPELRTEFKTTFRKSDIENYLLGLSQSEKLQDLTLPKDANLFWELVNLGKEFRDK